MDRPLNIQQDLWSIFIDILCNKIDILVNSIQQKAYYVFGSTY